MIVTLCINCLRPAPEYDKYQEISQHILVHIAAGITIIRTVNQGLATSKDAVPRAAHNWVEVAKDHIHDGNDIRDNMDVNWEYSPHGSCPEYKQITRRMNQLLRELDFMRTDLLGHFVVGKNGNN